jgi:hypothetical protein
MSEQTWARSRPAQTGEPKLLHGLAECVQAECFGQTESHRKNHQRLSLDRMRVRMQLTNELEPSPAKRKRDTHPWGGRRVSGPSHGEVAVAAGRALFSGERIARMEAGSVLRTGYCISFNPLGMSADMRVQLGSSQSHEDGQPFADLRYQERM